LHQWKKKSYYKAEKIIIEIYTPNIYIPSFLSLLFVRVPAVFLQECSITCLFSFQAVMFRQPTLRPQLQQSSIYRLFMTCDIRFRCFHMLSEYQDVFSVSRLYQNGESGVMLWYVKANLRTPAMTFYGYKNTQFHFINSCRFTVLY
jgi:hypothetical protein